MIYNNISNITNLVTTNAILHAKINEVKGEIPCITDLATIAALTSVGNKISNVIDIVKKAHYYAEMKDIKNKYFTTSHYKKFTSNILDAKITAKKLVNESGLTEKITRSPTSLYLSKARIR